MKVIVTKKDESVIYGGKIYKCDETFEADDVIAKSLMERGYVAAADAADEDKSLAALSYPELKKLAADMGIPANGKKEELIERIRNAADKQESEEEAEADADEEQESEEEAEADADEEQESEEEESEDEQPNTDMPE